MDTDRNLLFGVLALQADFIDAGQFAEACAAWAARKATPLADLLRARGWITDQDRDDVERLLERKLGKHGGDAHASLVTAAGDRALNLIGAVEDDEVRRTLAGYPRTGIDTAVATVTYRPETRERYTLTSLHAKGGIGQVWLATDGDLGRRVALKELRPERAGDAALSSRFLEEARITGQLEHPGIVPIYELARRGADGSPFYAMRFIQGRTLSEAARAYHGRRAEGRAGPLDLIALLNAFVAVCNAVAYAHSRRVIHRDLKPQNVVMGDFGEVVLLDWGLAKLADRPEDDTALDSVALDPAGDREATMQGQILGTPSYMAPEQAEGRPGQVDHRTDVYGLGAILYEVLAGRPPFDGPLTHEVLRGVVHEPPTRPRSVVPSVPAALEAVCLKALAKVPGERYGSARALADEVRHWLADEPVTAYAEPLPARAGRWMRRHRTLVSGAAVLLATVLLATSAGLVMLGLKNREVADQRDAALAAAQASEAVNEFLADDLLGQADPDVNARDRKVTVEDLLRKAAEKIDDNAKFAGRPEVEATLRLTLGKTFFKVGDLPEAEKHLRRAVALRSDALGPDDPRTLAAQEALADYLNRGPGRFDESVPLSRRVWGARVRILGPEHRDTLDSLDTYAGSLVASGRTDEAIPLHRECLKARRRVLGAGHPDTVASMNNLAFALKPRGEWAEAALLFREALDWVADGRLETACAATASNLALVLYMKGDVGEADCVDRLYADRAVRRLGPESQQADYLRLVQVQLQIDQGQVEQAVALARDCVAFRKRFYPTGHSFIGSALMEQGRGLVLLGRSAEAEAALAECLSIFAKSPPSLPHYTGWARCWYGVSLEGQGRSAEAELHLLDAERALGQAATTPARHYRQCVEQIVRLYETRGEPDRTVQWKKKLAE